MIISSVVQSILEWNPLFQGARQEPKTGWLSLVLEGTGLHLADPDRQVRCPLLRSTGAPVLVIEGFRRGRYVSSAVFSENHHELVTMVQSSIPPFTCRVERGVPRMFRSRTALPLKALEGMGDVDLAGDGSCIHSRKAFRTGSMKSLLAMQIREIEALEELIDSISRQEN